jgi:hypothetical protein
MNCNIKNVKNQTLLTRKKWTTNTNQIIDAIRTIDAKRTFDDAKRTNERLTTQTNERLTQRNKCLTTQTNKRLTTQTNKCFTLRFKKKFSPGKLLRACFTARNFDQNKKVKLYFINDFSSSVIFVKERTIL